jgi:hypothetical protein
MTQGRTKIGERGWLAALALWAAWGYAGYFLIARVLDEIRAIEWQYAHPGFDWIANQMVYSGQAGFLVTLVLLVGWCAGAYPLVRMSASRRRAR